MLRPSKPPKGVTHVRVPALEPAAEPLGALGRGTVRELVGPDLTRHLRLNPIVADGRRRGEAFVDIALLEQTALG